MLVVTLDTCQSSTETTYSYPILRHFQLFLGISMPPYQIPLQPIITRLKDRILALEKPLTDLDEKFASIVNYQGRREPWTPEMTRAKDAFKNAQARGNSAFKAVVDHGNQDNPDYYQMAKHAVIWGESKAEYVIIILSKIKLC